MELTDKERAVVAALKTGARISESWMDSDNQRSIVVLIKSDVENAPYTYEELMSVSKMVFESLLRKDVIEFLPTLTETRDAGKRGKWTRGWYQLKNSPCDDESEDTLL